MFLFLDYGRRCFMWPPPAPGQSSGSRWVLTVHMYTTKNRFCRSARTWCRSTSPVSEMTPSWSSTSPPTTARSVSTDFWLCQELKKWQWQCPSVHHGDKFSRALNPSSISLSRSLWDRYQVSPRSVNSSQSRSLKQVFLFSMIFFIVFSFFQVDKILDVRLVQPGEPGVGWGIWAFKMHILLGMRIESMCCRDEDRTSEWMFCVLERSLNKRHLGSQLHLTYRCQTVSRVLRKLRDY